MLAIEMAQTPFQPLLWTGRAYLVPRSGGRMLVGATVEQAGFEKQVTAGGMHALLGGLLEALPGAAEARVAETWSGLRPGTLDGLPLMGPLDDSTWLATGHYRNGILQAPATALSLAQAICALELEADVAAMNAPSMQ